MDVIQHILHLQHQVFLRLRSLAFRSSILAVLRVNNLGPALLKPIILPLTESLITFAPLGMLGRDTGSYSLLFNPPNVGALPSSISGYSSSSSSSSSFYSFI